MKTIQATEDLTIELYPAPAGQQPLLVLHSRAAEIDEECPEGIAVYAHEISDVIDALTKAAVVLADTSTCLPRHGGAGMAAGDD